MKTVRFYSGERIALADIVYATTDTPRQAQSDVSGLLVEGAQSRIVKGFNVSISGQTLTVSQGAALLAYKGVNAITPGLVVGSDAPAQAFDLTGLDAGSYQVFVTFDPAPANLDTRASFTAESTGFNQDLSVYTRTAAQFKVAVADRSPGPEWLVIAQVSLPSGAVQDCRKLLFEGDAGRNFAPTWGSAEDRQDARGLKPIDNLEVMIEALKVAIEDIKGTHWWVQTGGTGSTGSGGGTGSSGGGTGGGLTALPDDLTANSLTLGPVSGDGAPEGLFVQNTAGSSVFSVDALGNTVVQGTLSVAQLATFQTINAANLNTGTVTATGSGSFGGNLTIRGQGRVGDLVAASIESSGSISAATSSLGTASASTLTIAEGVHALSLAAMTANLTTVNAASLSLSPMPDGNGGTVNASAHIGGNLAVTGQSTFGPISASTAALQTLTTTGDVNAGGALNAPALAITLPLSGAVAKPLLLSAADGSELISADSQGNFHISGTLIVAGAQTNDATNAGALTATSFVNYGLTNLQGTLQVGGATTLVGLTATDATLSTLALQNTLAVTGASTLGDVSAQTLAVNHITLPLNGTFTNTQGTTTLGGVQAGDIQAQSLTAQGGGSFDHITALNGATFGHIDAQSISDHGDLSVGGNLTLFGSGTATGAFSVGSSLGAQSLQLTAASSLGATDAVALFQKSDGTVLARFNGDGSLLLGGGITLNGGDTADAVINAGALNASSIHDTGAATIDGPVTLGQTLSVSGDSTLANVTADALTVQSITNTGGLTVAQATALQGGATISGQTKVGDLQAQDIAVVTNEFGRNGNLSVAGQTVLGVTSITGGLSVNTVNASGGIAVGTTLSVAAGVGVGGALNVSGLSTLADVSATSVSSSTLASSGNASVGGSLTSGPIQAPELSIVLPSSGAAANPLSVTAADGTALLACDAQGDVTIAGVLTLASNTTGQANNLGAITVTSFSDLGNALIQQTLRVNGDTTLAGLTAGATALGDTTTSALGATTITASGPTTLQDSLSVTGSSSFANVGMDTLTATSGQFSGGVSCLALDVSGTTTLGGSTTAAAINADSLSTTHSASIGAGLTVLGASNLTTLGLSGAATFSNTLTVSGTTTLSALAVAMPAGIASPVTPITVTTSDGQPLMTLDPEGNLTVAGNINASSIAASSGGGATFTEGSGPPTDPNPVAGSAYLDGTTGTLYFAS